jgi:glucokinase
MTSVYAVDLGGTKTAIARVHADGRITERRKLPAQHALDATVDQISAAVRSSDAQTVGIIVPGIYNERTGMAWAPNLWGWDEAPLRDRLAAAVGVPAIIDSDRAGYVLGEQWLGAARGSRDVVFVAVGTGIGVGVISDGRVIRGARGIAGSAGWMAVDPRWRDEYARAGSWEWEAAGPAVARRAGTESGEAAAAAARAGDPRALAAIATTAEYLAMGIANLISIFDPEIVVLGGGLMNAADLLLEPLRAAVPRWAQPVASADTAIALTALGDDAGLLGAARLALLAAENQTEKEKNVG